MRMLHTSDWHLGRQLHGLDLLDAQAAFLDHLLDVVRTESVDAVVIAGDLHDRALPPIAALELLTDFLVRVRDVGARAVAISGNHDAPSRLGDRSPLLDPRISIRTDPRALAQPVVLDDEHGPIAVYAVPYLEPVVVAAQLPGDPGEDGRGPHARVTAQAARAIAADRAVRGGRSVVVAHGWLAGGAPSDSERDLGIGGVSRVPVDVFADVDYVALGHLHGPQALRESVRYSGSPLPYSFSERGHRKGSWLVDLDAEGLAGVSFVSAPTWRRLSRVRGELDRLLTSREFDGMERDVIDAVVTDERRPVDAMTTLQRRFPFAVNLRFEPPEREGSSSTYALRLRGRSELDIAGDFVGHVRGSAVDAERALLRDGLEAARLAELEEPAGAGGVPR